ncbi:hypothetical protein [Burkholderia ubonensis]|uniref:hypothetical protein n=1 Tax=Burkholderia ubonensis TaxID=101571 RepID=UPI000752B94A|nr:hypothetical protein [Burkholderia ubonensis]KVP17112.1 hypothetical protein WJ84_02210 [Burkholderia ubonensis]
MPADKEKWPLETVRHHIGAFLGACKDNGMRPDDVRAVLQEFLGEATELAENESAPRTPGNRWAAAGQPDPHGDRYDRERAALTLGQLTDDELANAAYLNYDTRPSVHELVAGTAFMPIVYMTAVKERIRWLSRKLAEATRCHDAATQ